MRSKWALAAAIGVLTAVTVRVVIAQEKRAKSVGETPQRQADEAAIPGFRPGVRGKDRTEQYKLFRVEEQKEEKPG